MADGCGRKLTIFAGFYTLIQGILWCLAASYSICIYKCILSYPFPSAAKDSSGFYTMFYSSYLNGSSCDGNPIFQGLKHAAESSKRTFYWMLGYSALSALWVLVSISLLVPIIFKRGGRSSKCTYYPWISITTIVVISDIISVIVYTMDVTHTLGTHDYLEFIGATGSWENVTGMAWTKQDTAAPAVAMTIFFSRMIIFWLLNFVLLYRVVNQCNRLSLHIMPAIDETDEKYRSWEKPIISQRQMAEERTNNSTLYLDPEPRNWKGVAERRQGKPNNAGQRVNYQSPGVTRNAQQVLPKVTYKLDEFGIPIEEVRSPRVGNYLDYSSEVPIVRPIREPNLLRRPSNRVAGQSMPPEELRGQVPWSYLRPPKPTSLSPSTVTRGPVIPAPDYGNIRQQKDYQFAATTARK